jgi:adenylate kinase
VFAIIDRIPTVSQITLHARQRLVQRLDSYASHHADLLHLAVFFIDKHLMPAVQRASISGKATVTVEDQALLNNAILLDIMLDVLSDRGFHAYVEPVSRSVPVSFNMNTGAIACSTVTSFRFQVEFPKSVLRSSLLRSSRLTTLQ